MVEWNKLKLKSDEEWYGDFAVHGKPSFTGDTGIIIAGTATKAMTATVACASGAYGMSVKSTLTGGASEGVAAYFEAHVAGTPSGDHYAAGIWMNVDAAPGSIGLRGLDLGIYAIGIDMSNTLIEVLNIQVHASATNPPSAIWPININCTAPGATPDGLFKAANEEAINFSTAATNTADQYGTIPIYIGSGHGTKYLRVFDT